MQSPHLLASGWFYLFLALGTVLVVTGAALSVSASPQNRSFALAKRLSFGGGIALIAVWITLLILLWDRL